MGKQRISELLAQLRESQVQDVENAAGIFTVAQVAVNALERQATGVHQSAGEPPALPAATVSKAELLQRYGSYNGCRRAAKHHGIRFSKTPSWRALEAAFSNYEALQALVQGYFAANPSEYLRGVTFEITPQA